LRHFPDVRGFPLLRSLVILIWLTVSAVALVKLTSRTAPPLEHGERKFAVVKDSGEKVPVIGYSVSVSAEMSELRINGQDQLIKGQPVSASISGQLPQSDNPQVVELVVRWKNAPSSAERRFARLTLYPPGKATITHVFDADGDIDDILELP
jgi:hypothetical protein